MPSESGEKRAASTTPPNAVARYPPPKLADRLPCPRCRSSNTKFCYYNNYNLSQPRHFCKACRRYWTQGGSLRNVPVGGGTRKNSKRSRSSVTSNSKPEPEPEPEPKPLVLPANNPDSALLPVLNCETSNLNENHLPAGTGSGNFISLLNAQHEPGFMGMVGYGFCEIGLGFGGRNTTAAYSGFGDFGGGIGNYDMFGGGESESFVWPGFPISKGFK